MKLILLSIGCGILGLITASVILNVKSGNYSNNISGTDSSKSSTVVNKTPTKTTPSSNDNNKTVYFTPSGKSYHYNRNYSSLKRSKTVLEGTQQKSISSGHADPCIICSGAV